MNEFVVRTRSLIIGLLTAACLQAALAHADQAAIPRIAVRVPPLINSPFEEGLRDGLGELGYLEGNNIRIDWRRTAATNGELQSLATELATSGAHVIVAISSPAARAAMTATTTPVVFFMGDPVAAGFAANLAHPGAHGTGVSTNSTELTGKRLQFLHQLAPRARRIFYLRSPTNPLAAHSLEEAQAAAQKLGMQLITLDAGNAGQLSGALRALSRSAGDAVFLTGELLFLANKAEIAQAVRKARLPAMFPYREYHDEKVVSKCRTNYTRCARRGLQDQIGDFLRVRDQRRMACIHLDHRCSHAFGHEALQIRIDRAILRRDRTPGSRSQGVSQ